MNLKYLSIGMALSFALSGACLAAPSTGQGAVLFRGSIVAPGCKSHLGDTSTLELSCPTSSGAANLQALKLAPTITVSALDSSSVGVKLLSESGKDHYHDQQYALVDGAGKPVRSGDFLVTLTLP